MRLCGQNFTSEIITRIQETLECAPDLSRRVLSRLVCDWLDWRTTTGEYQEGSCRKVLAHLNREQIIALPAAESPSEVSLDKTNHWVKLSECIPWDALADSYYQSMSNRDGHPGKDARLVIDAVR